MARPIDRRRFLMGSGAMLSLPALASLPGTARASSDPPKRLIVFYCVQGMPQQHWNPIGTPGSFTLNDIFLEPVEVDGQTINLADLRDDYSVVTGLGVASAMVEFGNAHNLAAGHLLTGTQMLDGGPDIDPTLSGGESVDSVIASAISDAKVPFSSLHYAVRTPWEICFTGPGAPVDRLTEPDAMITQLFGDFTQVDIAEFDRIRRRRQSVLDATKANADWVKARLSPADKHRLDEYLTRVEELERRFNASLEVGESCVPLAPLDLEKSPYRLHNTQVDWFHPWYDPDIATPAILDIIVEAIACDRSRVITLTLGDNSIWHWLTDMNGDPIDAGASGDWHEDTVHAYWGANAGDPLLEDRLRRVARWEHSMFARLLQKLKNHGEGEGSLLDNCMVLYVNEFGRETHVHEDQPFIVAGGCGGAIRTGQWLEHPSVPHNRLLLTMLQAFGIDRAEFGDPQWCQGGPLADLLI